jgi:uncharacterized protein YraI
MASIDKNIWDYLIKEINNPYGVAGLMGNIYAESGMIPNRVEALCLNRLKENGQTWTDSTYTAAVDSGKISRENFLHPLPNKQYGYGLCQWTSPGRKAGLYDLARMKQVSIGNELIQLQWLVTELKNNYSTVLSTLKNATSVKQASDIVLTKFECPANTGDSVKTTRAKYGQKYYDAYASNKGGNSTVANYDKYINSSVVHYISNSGSDENGQYHGGKAGDQTGKEWQLRSWYSRPWTCVLRYEKDSRVGQKLAELGCAAALNDLIGYDQYERDTYWSHLKVSNYDPSQVTIACEADCSAGVIANTRAVGYLLGIAALQNVNASYTGNMRAGFKAAGFTVLTDSKYLTSEKYLLPGDILLNDSCHTATNITKGSLATSSSSSQPSSSSSKGNTSYSGKGIGTATAKADMNIRSGSSTSNSSYGVISKGTKVEVLEKLSNGWYKIVWPGASCGYAYTSNTNNAYYTYVVNKTTTSTSNNSNKKVTAKDAATSFNKSLAGKYVTIANLNIRHGAGVSKAIMITIPKGTPVSNYGYYSVSNGTKWLYVQFEYQKVTYTGFASSTYLRK